jgi:hypothetical protein
MLDHIISYACYEHGMQRWRKCSSEERRVYRSAKESPVAGNRWINLKNDSHLSAAMGANHLGLTIGNACELLQEHRRFAEFISSFEREYGRDAQVRIVTDWVFEARNGKGVSYIELATLVAIYSKIGAKKGAVRITRDEIWRRAHGCKSKIVFAQVFQTRPFRFTKWQIRAAIDRLHARKFFARVTYARRQTFYSHRLTSAQLEASVMIKKTGNLAAAVARRHANADITRRIRAELLRLAQLPPL